MLMPLSVAALLPRCLSHCQWPTSRSLPVSVWLGPDEKPRRRKAVVAGEVIVTSLLFQPLALGGVGCARNCRRGRRVDSYRLAVRAACAGGDAGQGCPCGIGIICCRLTA